MLRRFSVATGAALLALTPATAHHSNGFHWAGDGQTLHLRVNLAITPQWYPSVETAISDWDESTELTLSSRIAGVDRRKCNPILGQILVCSFRYGVTGWFGIATIYYRISDNHMVAATTRLNDTFFSDPRYPIDTPEDWRALTACQEIGHDFGLDHQDETFDTINLGTCMDYTPAPAGGVWFNGFDYGPPNEHPNAHDYEELSIIYDHDDGFTTAVSATDFGLREVGRAVPQTRQGLGESPVEWGRAIHHDGRGRPDVFLKDLGGGERALTHVLWARGQRPH